MNRKTTSRVYAESVREDRNNWKELQHSVCMVCGERENKDVLEIHEILTKAKLPLNWHHRCNLLLIGGSRSKCDCHHSFQITCTCINNYITQLALKMIHDPVHYNLKEWIGLRNKKAPEFITQGEVDLRYSQLKG